jgi:hypothetical protein
MENIEKQIIDILDKKGTDYLTLKTLKNHSYIKNALKLTGKMQNTNIKKKLAPHLGDALKIVNGYKGLYVVRDISDTDFVINRIHKKACSLGELKQHFPIQTKDLVKLVSQMVMAGQLCVEFSTSGTIHLSINANPPAKQIDISQEASETDTSNDRQKMRAAYDHIGGGRGFVRIYAMREYLGWPEERFDQTLEQLVKELAIQLHYGDPSILTEKQLKASFVDDEGQVCITLTWRDV